MSKKTGGQAFPRQHWEYDGQDNVLQYQEEGMTLRDNFAAKALQGLCANPGGPFQSNDMSGWGIVNCDLDDVATESYKLADAMLKARGDA